MFSGSNEQLEQLLEYTLIVTAGQFQICNLTLYKNDMQYNSVLNLQKMPQKYMEYFRLLLDHLT